MHLTRTPPLLAMRPAWRRRATRSSRPSVPSAPSRATTRPSTAAAAWPISSRPMARAASAARRRSSRSAADGCLPATRPSGRASSGATASGPTSSTPFSANICATSESSPSSPRRNSLRMRGSSTRPPRSGRIVLKSGRRLTPPINTACLQPAPRISRNRPPISPQRY